MELHCSYGARSQTQQKEITALLYQLRTLVTKFRLEVIHCTAVMEHEAKGSRRRLQRCCIN
jgi:hypothetical protein